MEFQISKTKIDRLGDRLRKGATTDDDLRLLDEYRRSFTDAYEHVVRRIRDDLKLEPTGRPAKSTTSISEKLRRESIRLTQIQDIAGCRLIVPKIANQEGLISSLVKIFPEIVVIDRRKQPSHGYRAVHLVISIDQKALEIQIRTELQQGWAELSEKLSDLLDPRIKYGGGDQDVRKLLDLTSSQIAQLEELESNVLEMESDVETWLSISSLTEELRTDIMEHRMGLAAHKRNVAEAQELELNELRKLVRKLEGK